MTEVTEHNMTLKEYSVGRRVFFQALCSCGEASGNNLTTAGMAHSWHTTHVNRFPHLTKALVTASSIASRLAKNGSLLLAGATLNDAKVLAEELAEQSRFARRDAEQLALDLYERARNDVEEARAAHRSSR